MNPRNEIELVVVSSKNNTKSNLHIEKQLEIGMGCVPLCGVSAESWRTVKPVMFPNREFCEGCLETYE